MMTWKTSLLGFGVLLIASPASAAGIEQIEQRMAEIDSRLDRGLRGGALTGSEQQALRDRFQAVKRLQSSYSAGGYSQQELDDLGQRLTAIEAGIHKQANDAQAVETNPAASFAQIDARLQSMRQRVDAGASSGQLTAAEATGLRDRLAALEQVVARYRSDNVLSADERRDINTRLEAVSAGVARQRNDGQGR